MPEELFVRRVRISKEIPEDDYIAGLPVIRHLTQMGGLGFRKPVTFLVGENGTGKSTLLEGLAVALGFNAEGGTLSYQFSTADSHSDLYQYLTVEKGSRRFSGGYFLRAESFYNAASYLNTVYTADEMEKYYGGSLHARSHGESFFALIEKRFQGNGLYLMDEPEAALSP
ncbi:MAG: AAA family ATPase, partial [Oscillospiraceae bacterium]|nr:AAA family ATPase [Oscillospiraceae bacterium]